MDGDYSTISGPYDATVPFQLNAIGGQSSSPGGVSIGLSKLVSDPVILLVNTNGVSISTLRVEAKDRLNNWTTC